MAWPFRAKAAAEQGREPQESNSQNDVETKWAVESIGVIHLM